MVKGTLQRVLFLVWILVIIWIAPAAVLAQEGEEAQPVARVILVSTPTCPHCLYVKQEVLPPLEERYGPQLEITVLELTEPASYELFTAILEQNPGLPTGVPQLYIGQNALVGSDQIENFLPGLIEDSLAEGGWDWSIPIDAPRAAATAEPAASAANASAPLYLAYFYDPGCLECDRVQYDLQYLESQYPNLEVRRFDVRTDAMLNEALCEKYGVPDGERLASPAIFIGDHYLTAEEISVPRLRALLDGAHESLAMPPWETVDTSQAAGAASGIVQRFQSFSVLAVAGAGLLDGVNPCAFTTMIFFVSYLALVGRKGREILLVGAAFTAAVFLTYLTMGLGLAEVVRQAGSISLVGRIIYGATALFCLVLAALSLWDWMKIRQGRLNEIALQLPASLKKRIHATIRTRSRVRGYVGAAFGAGVLVSIFELACTGQVYLPTIIFVAGVAELRATAISYLVLYNLMFVLPLVAVFVVTYYGTSSQRLTVLFQRNAGLVKLLTALLFGVLGLWLGYWIVIG
jgi:glutaredoxin